MRTPDTTVKFRFLESPGRPVLDTMLYCYAALRLPRSLVDISAVTVPAISYSYYYGVQTIAEINSSTFFRPRRVAHRNIGAHRTLGTN
jgi:hypothetical protein